jgi:hypothetical protein
MTTTKARLSASVDEELLRAIEQVVRGGRSVTLSAWVNEALRAKLEADRLRDAGEAFIRAWEREHGVITDAEIAAAERNMADRAIRVRRPRKKRA